MCRSRVYFGLFFIPLLLFASFVGSGPNRAAARKLPNADLAILQVSGPEQATVGSQVTFTIEARNFGPATSELDVGVTFSSGLALAQMTCDHGISPDTPFCEYAEVARGTVLTTQVVATVGFGAGPTETATFCTNNEGLSVDHKAKNNCRSVTVAIISG